MNKRSSQLFENVVLALCGSLKIDPFAVEEPPAADEAALCVLLRARQASAVSDAVTGAAQAIVERVEAIEAEAK